jgi:succinate dehydrogenase / fumarate reductase membrane anchor subunit
MRESSLMKVQYLTAVAAVFLVTLHLLMQGVIVPYSTSISFDRVLLLYRSAVYATIWELLLVVVVVHGFNGLRIILLEWRQGKVWERWVWRGTLAAMALTVGYGTRTVVLAMFGSVS